MFSLLLLLLRMSYCIVTVSSLVVDLKENDLTHSIEKLLIHNNHLYVGTVNSLHRLSLSTLNRTFEPFKLGPLLDNPSCRQLNQCPDLMETNYHFKILLPVDNQSLLVCGTLFQGLCQLIDEDFRVISNASLPVVANDPVNSTIGLVFPEKNLIYFGVTYTNEGVHRWQIPNIAGRSLNATRFMKVLSADNDDESISRDDLSVRFMPRQQTTFIVQYIHGFASRHYIYLLTNQPNDVDQKMTITKIVRFCRENSNSILRSYTEIPLICVNSEWTLKTAQTMFDKENQLILIGHFTRKDGTGGTNLCSWNVQHDIDRAFEDNYRTCYAMGIGQRGLAFIKPNEACRKDESWSIPMNTENLCPWIMSDRLPYPVGGTTPVIGHSIYENLLESSSALQMYSFGATNLLFQGLINGTFKLARFDLGKTMHWFYSQQLPSQSSILSDVLFDSNTASFVLASQSKVYRLSFAPDCLSRLSCDECLSSSNNPFCGWCTMNQRCTLAKHCPFNSWQQESHQCTQIVNVQPLNASVDNSQWINLTLSTLPQLEHNEIYQCIFADRTMSAHTQAIKLDHNRLSCPTPSSHVHVQQGSHLPVRLSVIKWPSNATIATVPEFTFYNCSWYASCVSCQSQLGCQWCSQRCSSMCVEPSSHCPSFHLRNATDLYLESGQLVEIPLKFDSFQWTHPLECRLNETIQGSIRADGFCQISKIPELSNENDQMVSLTVHDDGLSMGVPIDMVLYRCDLYDSCDQCRARSKCSWCQGVCSSARMKKCATDDQCTSLRIEDFTPKFIPLQGTTVITIYLNELINEKIVELSLADVPCLVINVSNIIQCQSQPVNASRQGPVRIRFASTIVLLSRESIAYRQPAIISINPKITYEFGGQTLYFQGENLSIGNKQKISIGNYQCLEIKQTQANVLACRLPSMLSGLYNISVKIDNHLIGTDEKLRVTPNPSVQDIDPTISFASGGRLVTVRGMYFSSAQTITVQFSHRKWNAKLKVTSTDITSVDDGMVSSFHFRTPSVPPSSNDFPSPPFDVNFSLYFDDSILSVPNLIQFHYIADVLLNVSSIPPTLPYTGEELKLQVENLTEAASMSDIQLFIGCSECKLKTFTSKGITCQPPTKLVTSTAIVLNNLQQEDDCSSFNSSIGPIRFRIGYREYLIGYLSYNRFLSAKYSMITILSLVITSCLLTIAFLTLVLYLCLKCRPSKSARSSLATKTTDDSNGKPLWSTETSASTGPYYQVYEQISSSSSHENTLTRAPLLFRPHYQEKRCTPPLMEQLQMGLSFLTTISVDDEQLRQILLSNEKRYMSTHQRQSMELFYDLLHMKPFCQAFIDQLRMNDCQELLQCYAYVFRYDAPFSHTISSTREKSLVQFFSTLFLHSKSELINHFHIFDDFLRILIDLIDSSPCDQVLHRSARSISPSSLLLFNIQYRSLQLTIHYENFLRFQLPVLDCDTIDQIKQKILRYFNSYEQTYRLVDFEQLDLIVPSSALCLCSHQMPMLKHYAMHSTMRCQKKSQWKRDQSTFTSHLCTENQLSNDEHLTNEKLKENKSRLQPILIYFYQQIANGLNLFASWANEQTHQDNQLLFQQYIQLVSDVIRRLNRSMLCRSTCPIVESCLHVIADGLEFIFDTKTEFASDIELLFMDDKKHFSSFDKNNLNFSPSNRRRPSLSPVERRSLILTDDTAIDCLFKLYQFYEIHSEPINQHIGENHVSVLLPVHHLLVQIRQLLKSDTTSDETTLI